MVKKRKNKKRVITISKQNKLKKKSFKNLIPTRDTWKGLFKPLVRWRQVGG